MSEPLLRKLPEVERQFLADLGRIATERGERAFLVGGSVRDLLLDRSQSDLDVVVEGDALAVAQAFSRLRGGELTRHHAFQTATIETPDGRRVDVATARSEHYPRPGQLPQVTPGTLDEDLRRRDFTINTMAIELGVGEQEELIDLLNGRQDLDAGVVRVMHSKSFADDPTRILRALRFALRFAYDLDEHTAAWLQAAVVGGYLDTVSADRVRKEVALAFTEAPTAGPALLAREGVLEALCPGLQAPADALAALQELLGWYQALPAADDDPVEPAWTLVLGCCAAQLAGQERWGLSRRMRLSRRERVPVVEAGNAWKKALTSLQDSAEPPSASVVDAAMGGLPAAALLVGAALAGRASEGERWVRLVLGQLRGVAPEINGEELVRRGVPEGPGVGIVLRELRAARLDGSLRNRAGELALVDRWLAANRS